MSNSTVTIGLISFRDLDYLKINIPILKQQDYPNLEIAVCCNEEDDSIYTWLQEHHPDLKTYHTGENLGFGGGHNFLMSKCHRDYYLAFNSDMYPAQNFVSKLVECMDKDPKVGCVTGKLLEWSSFPKEPDINQVQFIDTTGLIIFQNHQVVDRGQGALDKGQFEHEEEIWGASGAAPLLRMSALRDIAHSDGEYFDKDFFLYKEDIDLTYRLRWAGWKTIYTPNALAWHDRSTAQSMGLKNIINKRKKRSNLVREQSFLNHLLFIKKNASRQYSFKVRMKIRLFLLKYMLFLLFFEIRTLGQIPAYFSLRNTMIKKRTSMPIRISVSEMERWFQ